MILNILKRCKTYSSELGDSIVAKELEKVTYWPTYHSITSKNILHHYLLKKLNDAVKYRSVVEFSLTVFSYKESDDGGETSCSELGKFEKLGGLDFSEVQSFLERIIEDDKDISRVSWSGFIKFSNSHWVETEMIEDVYGEPKFIWKEFKVPSIKTFEI